MSVPKAHWSIAIGVTVLWISSCTPRAPVPLPRVAQTAAIDSARRVVQAIVTRERVAGLAVTVSIGGSANPVVWHEGFGYADVEKNKPATPHTLFRIGSISKLVTALTLMQQVQTGGLALDEPIGTYMAQLPRQLRGLTLRQIAGHQAGIRHYRGAEFFSTASYERLSPALSIFINDSLVAAPGTKYSYSSYGFNLIGAVMEERLGMPFTELVRVNVLVPLGMKETVPDRRALQLDERAGLYVIDSTGIRKAPVDDLSGRWPSGGYLSSSDDLARLGRAVLGPSVLNAQALHTLVTPQQLSSDAPTPVGIAWRVSTDSAGRTYYHHGGSSNGGTAFLLVYPKEGVVVALAMNAFATIRERDALAIATPFLGD
jgi:serine beta-lactamase-like protein LACTB, mitochondrial